MLANIAAHGAQLHWVALKLQYCANIGRILLYRPIFIQYVNIVPIFSQYCLLVGPGTPPPGELNTRGVVKYSDFGPIDGYISETVQDRRQVSINHF